MNISYTAKKLANVFNGELKAGKPETEIKSFTTDSRKSSSEEGQIFIAIKGKYNDGHKFLNQAYQNGVRIFLLEDKASQEIQENSVIIQVKNTLEAFQRWMSQYRSEFDLPVMAITGSNGKTTVKEWLNQLLSDDFRILRSPNSWNSQIGVPLSISNLDDSSEFAIIEAGISLPGEMKSLERIIQPQMGLLTNIGESHRENFDSKLELIQEKLELFKNCHEVFCSSLDSEVLSELKKINNNVLTWGNRSEDDLKIIRELSTPNGAIISVEYKGEPYDFYFDYSDSASLENLKHCVLIMLHLDYSYDLIQERIKRLLPLKMRMEMSDGVLRSKIINDAYSFDLKSLEIALDFMLKQKNFNKKIVVLSDFPMDNSTNKFRELNAVLENNNIDLVIGIGSHFIQNKSVLSVPSKVYPSKTVFEQEMKEKWFEDSLVLIKGARFAELESIAEWLQYKSHVTKLEISLEALKKNLIFFRSKLKKDVKLMVMVKAFSYGSGGVEMANFLQFNKVNYLGVAYVDEGVALRRQGISMPIMVMSPLKSSLMDCFKYNLEPEIYSLDLLNEVIRIPSNQDVKIHLKLNTGMNRLGFNSDEIAQVIDKIKGNDKIKIVSVFTHLSSADVPEEDKFTLLQLESFEMMSKQIIDSFDYSILRHSANTAGILRFENAQYDMVRLGIGLHGVSSVPEFQEFLEPSMTLKSHITQIQDLKKGDSVGYGRRFKALNDMKIAVVSIGYADGLSRRLGNGVGSFKINGKSAPIVGSICMDMTMVDVSQIVCEINDEVIIFGSDPNISEIANQIQTIPYEIMTSISRRVNRVYLQD